MTAVRAAPVTRDELEAKLRELAGGVTDTAAFVKTYAATIAVVLVVGMVAAAFLAGRRRGRGKMTIVEIKRI